MAEGLKRASQAAARTRWDGTLSPLRRKTLEHIRSINDGMNVGARCPYGEMIQEAEELIADGLSEWRSDERSSGRWLTEAGRLAIKDA